MEILVTIVIMGLTFTAILGGMITSITVSDLHRNQATADTLARNAAESVKGVAYVPCPATYAVPSGTSITLIEYWYGTAPTPSSPYAVDKMFKTPCPPQDQDLLQRITIAASSGGVTETVQVLKRQRPIP